MWKMPRKGTNLALATILAGTLGLSACSKIEQNRGYVPDAADLAEVEIGVATRQTVQQSLGSPSTVGTFDDTAWYYIRSRHERLAFFRPEVVSREVVAIYFDENNHVDDVAHYGLEDGYVVSYSNRETPTRGRELTVLEQLLGNVGRSTLPTPQ